MQDFLFDTPLWFLLGTGIIGIALFVYGNRRTDAALCNIGAGIFCIGVLFFLMSWFVDTDREKCVRRSDKLVAAVVAKDWPTMQRYISPQFKLSMLGSGDVLYEGRDQMIDATKDAVDRFGLKSAKVTSIKATNTGDYIKVLLDIYSVQDFTIGYPLPTSWEFDWQKSDDAGWQLTEIICLKINGKNGDEIRGQFPHVSGGK